MTPKQFQLRVPGYAAMLSRGGPDIFNNVNGLAWSDQLGLRDGTSVRFNGKPNLTHDFHFPFTIPQLFSPGDDQAAVVGTTAHSHTATLKTMFITAVVVTFGTDSGVRVDRIRVFDRLALIFDTNVAVGGPLGLSSPTTWINTHILGQNLHQFSRVISRSIGVTVTVNFGAGGGLIRFTGAGIFLEAPSP